MIEAIYCIPTPLLSLVLAFCGYCSGRLVGRPLALPHFSIGKCAVDAQRVLIAQQQIVQNAQAHPAFMIACSQPHG